MRSPISSTFHDAPTEIEQKLFVMFLEHRMRAFQGTFHVNPDYALWYGWSEMQRDLTEIKTIAAELRAKQKSGDETLIPRFRRQKSSSENRHTKSGNECLVPQLKGGEG